MSYQVTIDASQWQAYAEQLKEKFGSLPEYIEQYMSSSMVPALQSSSASARKVRTGTYSNGWEADSDSKSAFITNEAPYWRFLEFGTSRGIQAVPVAGNAVEKMVSELPAYISKGLDIAKGGD